MFANFKQNKARSTNSFWGTEMQNPFRRETEIAIRASGMHHEAILSWRFELAENWETPMIRYQNVTNRINTLFESVRSLKWHDQVCLDKFLQDFLPSCSFLKINTFGTLYDQPCCLANRHQMVLTCFNIPQSQGKLRSGSQDGSELKHFKNWTVNTSWIRENTRHHQNVWLPLKHLETSRIHSEINFVQFVAVGIWRWEAFPGCARNVIQEHSKP